MNFWKMVKVQYCKPLHNSKSARKAFVKKINVGKSIEHFGHIKWAKKRLSSMSPKKRIEKLIEYSNFELLKVSQRDLELNRAKFNRVKSKYHEIWFWCFCCRNSKVKHIHHIFMLKNGGSNSEENLIGLCHSCHASIHEWIKKPVNEEVYDVPFDYEMQKDDILTKEYRAVVG